SADGLCLQFQELPPFLSSGNVVEVTLLDTDRHFLGELVWVRHEEGGAVAGFRGVGSIKGTCHEFRVPDLLIGLQRTARTGIFEVTTGRKCTNICFRGGDMIFASSNQEDDRFGEVLLKGGKITLAQYIEASALLKGSGKRLGQVLIDLGYLKPSELIWAVRNQVVEIIVNLLTTECGTFEFREDAPPSKETINLNLSAANLIYRGIRRLNNFQYIIQDFPPLEANLSLSQNPLDLFQDLSLDNLGKDVLAHISYGKTVREILDVLKLNDFEVMKTIYALLSARIVVVRRDDEPAFTVSHEEVISEPLAGIDAEFLKTVASMYSSSEHLTHYAFLGVSQWATLEEIKRAYFKMAKEFHPDRHFNLPSEDVKRKLNSIFARITDAYTELSNPGKRKEYDQKIGVGVAQVERTAPQSKQELAETSFNEGRSKILLGMYVDAEKLLAQAIYLDPAKSIYHYYHGLALSKFDSHGAARSFEEAIRLDPNKSNYYSALGHAFVKLGFNLRAKRMFEKALSLESDNQQALEGLQLVERALS
ncbi:MAG: DUF4388 domain-containing protein, partial [Thermodesulfovibrionales bacterium]